VGRSERLIKLRDSWFSPKSIEVLPRNYTVGGRALDGLGLLTEYQPQPNSECLRVSLREKAAWAIRSRDERGTTQTVG